MTGSDDVSSRISKKLLDRFPQIPDGAGIGFLNEQVSRIGVLESKLHQIHRFVQVHQETGHIRIGDGNGMIVFNLFDEKRYHGPTGEHDIAIPGTADDRSPTFCRHPGIGIDDMFHHGLGNPHGIDGVSRLIRGKTYHPLYPGIDGCMEHIVRANDVGLDGLHGKEFTGRNLFQRCCMENIIHSHIEFYFPCLFRILCLQLMAHVILFLFIPGKNPDFTNISL